MLSKIRPPSPPPSSPRPPRLARGERDRERERRGRHDDGEGGQPAVVVVVIPPPPTTTTKSKKTIRRLFLLLLLWTIQGSSSAASFSTFSSSLLRTKSTSRKEGGGFCRGWNHKQEEGDSRRLCRRPLSPPPPPPSSSSFLCCRAAQWGSYAGNNGGGGGQKRRVDKRTMTTATMMRPQQKSTTTALRMMMMGGGGIDGGLEGFDFGWASFPASVATSGSLLSLISFGASSNLGASSSSFSSLVIAEHSTDPAAIAAAWSIFLMLVLVGLLTTWERGVSRLQQSLPPPLLPVLNSMLGEIGGLGFIGLLLSTFVATPHGGVGEFLEHAGESTLEDPEILTETFEFLHTAFFQVGMTYFSVAGLLVVRALRQLAQLDQVTQVAMQDDNFNCLSAMVATAAGSSSLYKEVEAVKSSSLVSTEDLLVRERLVQQHALDPSAFRVENYFGQLMGHVLEEMVELAPCTAWLPLVPALSQGRSIDMSHDVVSASSSNALLSSGYFISTIPFVTVSTLFASGTLVWGAWNHWKMQNMKRMVLPTLQQTTDEGSGDDAVTMIDPPYTDPVQLAAFDSSPGILGYVEAAVAGQFFPDEEDKDDKRSALQLKLFGNAGRSGPELYLNSIKFHTWLVTTQLVFWGTQIVSRDVSALATILAANNGGGGVVNTIGRPELVGPELVLYGTFVGAAIVQLLVLAPQTFWNYVLVTSVEEFANPDVLRASCSDQGILSRDREKE